MATAHLIHGYLGSGKSTYARQLATDLNAVYISMDDWYLQLFTDGTPTSYQDYEALRPLWVVADEHWPRILRAGVSVVLDFGFWARADRDTARHLAVSSHADCVLHWVRCDDATALRRCTERNRDPSWNFVINDAEFVALAGRYERPGPDEIVRIIDTND